MAPHLTDDELTLHYYGETPDDARPAVEAHLACCGTCRAALAEMAGVLALVDQQPLEDPGPAFERTAWARLEPALAAEPRGWRAAFGWSSAWLVTAGAAAAVVVAFAAGWMVRGPVDAAAPSAPAAAVASPVRERVLLVAVGEHLERSQMVLVELMNAGDGDGPMLADERERAADLVAANRLYRQTAVQVGDEALGDVLGDLERVLLEVANGSGELAGPELDALRARIENRGLLFRVRVLSSEMQDRERQELERGREAAGSPVSFRRGLTSGSVS
ncbi:MAG: hypothetical protein AB7O67_08090 [Vicinamibacterales bacterium]